MLEFINEISKANPHCLHMSISVEFNSFNILFTAFPITVLSLGDLNIKSV